MQSNDQQCSNDRRLWGRLMQERQPWEGHWRELSDYFAPKSLHLDDTAPRNSGTKAGSKIKNSVTVQSVATCSSGLSSYLANAAESWFSYGLDDPDLMAWQPVKLYLEECTRRIRTVLLSSNFYQMLPGVYNAAIVFGTTAFHMDADEKEVLRCYQYPTGTYVIGSDHRGAVDTIARRLSMTARQMMQKFGEKSLPQNVKNALANNPEQYISGIIHIIGPNEKYKPGQLGGEFKRYRSCYFMESDQSTDYLMRSGYDDFPAMVARWELEGRDQWGTGQSAKALEDAKSLMLYEKRIAQAVEKQVHPATKGPLGLDPGTILPGDHIQSADADKISSLYDGNAFRIDNADAKAQRLESSIKTAHFVDLFLMLAESDRRQITAEEIRAKQAERVLALVQPTERLNRELFGPALERAFNLCQEQGILPKPPDEIRGLQVRVTYQSLLHKAQKMAKLSEIDRLTNYVSALAQLNPVVMDKFDADQAIDEYADGLGVPSTVVRSDEDVAALRKGRAQQEQQMQQQQQAAALVQGANTLSQTDTSGKNALTDLLNPQTGA